MLQSILPKVYRVHYKPLEEDTGRSRSQRTTVIVVLIVSVLITVLSAIGTAIYLLTSSTMPDITHCGDSHETALALGCQFDLMSFAWLPPSCYDAELSAEFEAARNWTWYEDKEGAISIPKSDVRRGDRIGLHVYWEYHLVHCTFMWKKMHRAIARGGYVDSLVADYGHTHHCANMFFLEGIPDGDLHAFIKTKYPTCKSKKLLA